MLTCQEFVRIFTNSSHVMRFLDPYEKTVMFFKREFLRRIINILARRHVQSVFCTYDTTYRYPGGVHGRMMALPVSTLTFNDYY